MTHSYKYIYPDFTYTDPKIVLLINLLEITNPDVLILVESALLTKDRKNFTKNL
jgi:cell filamentation protein